MRKGQAKGEEVEPIGRWGPGGELLLDPTAVRLLFKVSERTVRRRCEPVACDVTTKAPLYDQEMAEQQLAGVRTRRHRSSAAG